MGCQLSVEQASYLVVNDLGLDEADLQGWQLKDDHIECLGLVSKACVMNFSLFLRLFENQELVMYTVFRQAGCILIMVIRYKLHNRDTGWSKN